MRSTCLVVLFIINNLQVLNNKYTKNCGIIKENWILI